MVSIKDKFFVCRNKLNRWHQIHHRTLTWQVELFGGELK
jgi:hypothetical protein